MITQDRKKADIVVDIVNSLERSRGDGYYKQGNTDINYNQKGEINTAHIKLLQTDNHGNYLSKTKLYAVAIHEIGHAIGIMGHSQSKNDVMYGFNATSEFSAKDKETIRLMYSKIKRKFLMQKVVMKILNLKKHLVMQKKFQIKQLLGFS